MVTFVSQLAVIFAVEVQLVVRACLTFVAQLGDTCQRPQALTRL